MHHQLLLCFPGGRTKAMPGSHMFSLSFQLWRSEVRGGIVISWLLPPSATDHIPTLSCQLEWHCCPSPPVLPTTPTPPHPPPRHRWKQKVRLGNAGSHRLKLEINRNQQAAAPGQGPVPKAYKTPTPVLSAPDNVLWSHGWATYTKWYWFSSIMAKKNKQPPGHGLTHLLGPPIDILLAERLWKVGGSWGFRLCVCDLDYVPSFWDKHGSQMQMAR